MDFQSVLQLHRRNPARSKTDHNQIIRDLADHTLFRGIPDLQSRSDLRKRLLSIDFVIPSLETFLRDTIWLEPGAKIMRSLLPTGTKLTTRISFRRAFENYSGRGILQKSDLSFKTYEASAEEIAEVSYQQLWLFAWRYFPQLGIIQPLKDPGEVNPLVKASSDRSINHFRKNLVDLAYKLGFRTDNIVRLREANPDDPMVEDFLRQTRPQEFYNDSGAEFDRAKVQILQCMNTIRFRGPRSLQRPVEQVLPLQMRCGKPHERTLSTAKEFFYYKEVHTTPRPPMSCVSVNADIFRAFFGCPRPESVEDDNRPGRRDASSAATPLPPSNPSHTAYVEDVSESSHPPPSPSPAPSSPHEGYVENGHQFPSISPASNSPREAYYEVSENPPSPPLPAPPHEGHVENGHQFPSISPASNSSHEVYYEVAENGHPPPPQRDDSPSSYGTGRNRFTVSPSPNLAPTRPYTGPAFTTYRELLFSSSESKTDSTIGTIGNTSLSPLFPESPAAIDNEDTVFGPPRKPKWDNMWHRGRRGRASSAPANMDRGDHRRYSYGTKTYPDLSDLTAGLSPETACENMDFHFQEPRLQPANQADRAEHQANSISYPDLSPLTTAILDGQEANQSIDHRHSYSLRFDTDSLNFSFHPQEDRRELHPERTALYNWYQQHYRVGDVICIKVYNGDAFRIPHELSESERRQLIREKLDSISNLYFARANVPDNQIKVIDCNLNMIIGSFERPSAVPFQSRCIDGIVYVLFRGRNREIDLTVLGDDFNRIEGNNPQERFNSIYDRLHRKRDHYQVINSEAGIGSSKKARENYKLTLHDDDTVMRIQQ